jgi:hypothetical protein
MFQPIVKKLVCPACGDVIADARYRRWPGNLTLTDVRGHRVNPVAAGVLRIVEREEADADARTRATAQARRELVEDHLAELIYDLRCPRGHSTLRAAPDITRAMTRAKGDWVQLS